MNQVISSKLIYKVEDDISSIIHSDTGDVLFEWNALGYVLKDPGLTLDFINCNLDDSSLMMLFSLVPHQIMEKVENLYIEGNDLRSPWSAFGKCHLPNLRVFGIKNNKGVLSLDGIKQVQFERPDNLKSLSTLILNHNGIQGDELVSLCSLVLPSLMNLVLNNNPLGIAGIRGLFTNSAVSDYALVKNLNLLNCELGDECLANLSKRNF